jgi:hypothetical protein
MSNPNEPKAPPNPPVEGPTQAFRLKFDGWMAEMMKQDLGLDDTPPAEEQPPEVAASPAPSAAPAPPAGNPPAAKR